MKELFKNKLFIIISLFIIFNTFIYSSCFASFDFNYNDNNYSLPDLPFDTSSYDYVIFITNGVNINVASLDENYKIVYKNNNFTLHGTTLNSCNRYELEDNNWVYKESSPYYSTGSLTGSGFYNVEVIYSTVDIYDKYSTKNDIQGNLVFQAAPQQVEQVTEVMIPAIQQVEEIPQGMNQVLQVIIPIGLIVLSIGLVVYLTRLVIYRMKS